MQREAVVYEDEGVRLTPSTSGPRGAFPLFGMVANQENVDPVSGLLTAASRPANSPLTPGAIAAAARAAALLPELPAAGAPSRAVPPQAASRAPLAPPARRAGGGGPEGRGRQRCAAALLARRNPFPPRRLRCLARRWRPAPASSTAVPAAGATQAIRRMPLANITQYMEKVCHPQRPLPNQTNGPALAPLPARAALTRRLPPPLLAFSNAAGEREGACGLGLRWPAGAHAHSRPQDAGRQRAFSVLAVDDGYAALAADGVAAAGAWPRLFSSRPGQGPREPGVAGASLTPRLQPCPRSGGTRG